MKLNIENDLNIHYNESLGEGGTALIYKAKLNNPSLIARYGNIDAAIKILKLKDTGISAKAQSDLISGFFYEVALLSSLPKSPFLVQFIGYSENPMTITMKYYPASLKLLLEHSVFEFDNAICIKIAYEIAEGMRLLHEAGILHLDLKPCKDSLYQPISCNV